MAYLSNTIHFPGDEPSDSEFDGIPLFAVLVRLPFRLRFDGTYRVQLDPKTAFYARNQVQIDATSAEPSDYRHWYDGDRWRGQEEFFTDVCIIADVSNELKDVHLTQGATVDGGIMAAQLTIFDRSDYILESINTFIVAFHYASGFLHGGKPLHRLTIGEMHRAVYGMYIIETNRTFEVNDESIEWLLSQGLRSEGQNDDGGPFYSELHTGRTDVLDRVGNYTALVQDNIYYQYLFDARSAMVAHDPVSAILFSVVALEATHAQILRECLSARASEWGLSSKDQNEFLAERLSNLLRNGGVYELLILSSLYLLSVEQRPSFDMVTKALRGITIRNEIMHAAMKKGKYKAAQRRKEEVREAFTAVCALCDHFCSILEHDTSVAD